MPSATRTLRAVGRWSAQLLVGLFAAVSSLVVVATLVTSLAYPPEELKEMVLGLANEALRGEISLGPVFISPLSGLVVRDLVVLSSEEFDRAPAFSLDEFILFYDLGRFVSSGRISIEVAEARGVRVNLIELPGVGWNFEYLVEPTEEEEEEPFTWDDLPVEVRLRRLAVEDLQLTVSDGITADLGGLAVVIGPFDTGNPGPLSLELRKEPGPVSLRLGPPQAPQAAGRIEELTLKLSVLVGEDPLAPSSASGDFLVTAAGINLSAPVAFAPEGELLLAGNFRADLATPGFELTGGRLRLGDYLSLGLALSARMGDEPRAEANLRLDGLELKPLVRELAPFLPAIDASGGITGAVSLDVRLNESLEAETARVAARFDLADVEAGMALPTGPARVAGLSGSLAVETEVRLDDPTALPVVDLAADLSLSTAEQGPYRVGDLALTVDGSVDLARLSTDGLRLDLKAGLLTSLGEPGPLAVGDLALAGTFSADMEGGDLAAEGLRLSIKTVRMAGAAQAEPLAVENILLQGSLAGNLSSGNFSLRGIDLSVGDALRWRGGAEVGEFGRGGASLTFDDFAVDLGRALALVPPGMVELPPLEAAGKLGLRGRLELAPGVLENDDPLALARSLKTNITVELKDLSLRLPEMAIDGVNAGLFLDFDSGDGSLELEAGVAEVVLPNLPLPVAGVEFLFKGRLKRLEDILVEKLEAGVESLDLVLSGSGAVSNLGQTPIAALELQARVGRVGRPLKAGAGLLDLEGQVGLELSLRGPVQGPRPVQLSGRLRFHRVNFRQGIALAVTGIEGELPIDTRVVLSAPLPLAGGGETSLSPFGERRYELLAPFTPPPHLTIEEVRIAGTAAPEIRVENLELTWGVTGGGLHIWRLAAKALGGSLVGKLKLIMTDEVPAVSLQLEFGDVNVGYLIEGVEPAAGAEINGDLRLTVRGKDLDDLVKRFDVEGSINITRIGKEVLDKMLLFLDPEGTNPSITQVRGLLGGLQKQPDLVTMDLKNQRMTMTIRIVDTGFSLLSLFTSFIDLSLFTIPRIPIADIMRRSMLPEAENGRVGLSD